MLISHQAFRQQIIDAVMALKKERPEALLYLLYTPELADPLSLIDNTQRETQLIWQSETKKEVPTPSKQHSPRLITLDCRRIAAYLLETDPALDDPLFEESIKQAYAEFELGQKQNPESTNSERSFSQVCIAGWLLSTESSNSISRRLHPYTSPLKHGSLRWTNPLYLSALWPTMIDEQKHVLLGDSIFLSFNNQGQFQQYQSPSSAEKARQITRFKPKQITIIKNIQLVRDLLPAWKNMTDQMGGTLPDNAEQVLHSYVQEAQQAGLDAESTAFYALTAVQLKAEATQDPEWNKLIQHTATQALPLRDEISQLSDVFFDQYSLYGQK